MRLWNWINKFNFTILKVLSENGYHLDTVRSRIKEKCDNFVSLGWLCRRNVPSILHLPSIGEASARMAKHFSVGVRCYFSANLRALFGVARPMLRPTRKDHLSTHPISSVIYRFRCQCDVDYVGKTGQRLEARNNQHVPGNIRKGIVGNLHKCVNISGSEIAEYFIKNQ